MAKNYDARINALKSRRQLEQPSRTLEKAFKANILDSVMREAASTFDIEDFEKRTSSSALKYALGAMQEVDERFTKISFGEADRIVNQLKPALQNLGKTVDTELQGSLPLNVHLRRVSDVDLLVLPNWYLTYSTIGSKASTYAPSSASKSGTIMELRSDCVKILQNAYPQVTVDDSGSKCITLSGGSLRREVDVVPALWYDTVEYQREQYKSYRAVEVYDKRSGTFNENKPFMVRALINYKDDQTQGGCKKAIRLLKTLKIDADIDINFSSFNIMSVVYRMEDWRLNYTKLSEGALLVSLKNWLNALSSDSDKLRSLYVVDSSRKIIQNTSDEFAFQQLRAELNELLEQIGREIAPYEPLRRDEVLRDSILY